MVIIIYVLYSIQFCTYSYIPVQCTYHRDKTILLYLTGDYLPVVWEQWLGLSRGRRGSMTSLTKESYRTIILCTSIYRIGRSGSARSGFESGISHSMAERTASCGYRQKRTRSVKATWMKRWFWHFISDNNLISQIIFWWIFCTTNFLKIGSSQKKFDPQHCRKVSGSDSHYGTPVSWWRMRIRSLEIK